MKTATLITYNRPHYLKRVIESLRKNDTDGWILHIGVEPGCPAVMKVIEEIDFMRTIVHVNSYRLGIDLNGFTTLMRAFDTHGSLFNIYMEEDMELSPDVFSMAEWYRKRTDPYEIEEVGVAFAKGESDPRKPDSLGYQWSNDGYFGWGLACTRRQWYDFYMRHWFHWEPWMKGRGWDWHVGHMVEHESKKLLRPHLNRVRHIGMYGEHTQGDILKPDERIINHTSRFSDYQVLK